MSNTDLIVSGSVHQADRHFSDVSRGRQCAFNSFPAHLRAGTIPDTETLSLTHLPDRVRWPTVTADPAKLNQLPDPLPDHQYKTQEQS